MNDGAFTFSLNSRAKGFSFDLAAVGVCTAPASLLVAMPAMQNHNEIDNDDDVDDEDTHEDDKDNADKTHKINFYKNNFGHQC